METSEPSAEAVPTVEQPPAVKVEITLAPDGNLTIMGPTDARLVLRMLHEAVDLVVGGITFNRIMSRFAQAQQVQKPGLRDVLAFSKVKP